jgi:tetratricopeptide (TPR) repeat protein
MSAFVFGSTETNTILDPIKIILLLMIKNESRIIRRSILSALKIADAICISDTGSTDDTVQVLADFYPTLSVPAKTYTHLWTNFGVNRSKSFEHAKQFCEELKWNPERTYVLAIDADMELVVEPAFNKQTDLTDKGHSMIQKAGTLHYANARLLRLDQPWTCVGATHEYWSGPMGSTIPDSKLWINDKNDGGCKADKFTRDLQMLQDELVTQPQNQRTHFYLAQTLKSLNRTEESIEYYKKRIELGGWFEEVWFSHYMIAQQYLQTNRPEEAELWVLKGQKYNNYRAEALYLLVKHFRIIGQQWKAMHYYYEAKKIKKPEVALFQESEVYDHLLDYEYSVLQYYVNPADKKEGLRSCVKYLFKPQSPPLLDNVFSNIEFYVQALPSLQMRPLALPDVDQMKPSSCSLVHYQGQLVMNARYVNYHTSDQGVYTARDPENIVRTENLFVASPSLPPTIVGPTDFMKSDLPTFPTNILGLEDLRLFVHKNQLLYTATTKSTTPDTNYKIVMGHYDVSSNHLVSSRVLEHPIPQPCEKNWLFIGSADKLSQADHTGQEPTVIYNWHPFQTLTVDPSSNVLKPLHTFSTPPYFTKLRGSANPVLYNGKYICLTHVVKHATPRKYYHHLVILNKETLKPEALSVPFYFATQGIEYSLGFDIQGDTLTVAFSSFDANPKLLTTPLKAIEFLPIPI